MYCRSCNCISRSSPPTPNQVPFSPALSKSSFTTDITNEVNGMKAQLSFKRDIDVRYFLITGSLLRLGMSDSALLVFLVKPHLTGLLHAILLRPHFPRYNMVMTI